MGYDVTSWFIDQLSTIGAEPKRVYSIGTSDYSNRVTKWPVIDRSSRIFKSVSFTVPLANADGGMNHFFSDLYTIPNTATIKIGFTHPTSGDELISIFTGKIHNVGYSNKQCSILLKDRLFEFSNLKIGATNDPVTFDDALVSDIAWTLCTCYGGLDSTQGSNNTDIDYGSFEVWSNIFSRDSLFCDANYTGEKVKEALSILAEISDSAIWVEGDGRVTFKRFTEADSNDILFTRDEFIDLSIDVETIGLINRQHVGFAYSTESDYWVQNVSFQNTASVNSFSLHEEKIENKSIWYTTSASAINLAQRRVVLYKTPPKRFKILTSFVGIHRQLSETIRLVDSFYNQDSSDPLRIISYKFDVDKGSVSYLADTATAFRAFTLDVSTLDNGVEVLI